MKDWRLELITPEQAEQMLRTEQGKKDFMKYIMRARIAYAVQDFLECCQVPPTEENQQRACEILYNAVMRVPVWEILAYINSIADRFNTSDVKGHA